MNGAGRGERIARGPQGAAVDDGRFQLQVRTVQRATLPGDGDVASWLTVQLARAVEDGRLGPVAGVVVRERVVDLVDLAPVRSDGRVPWLLAGLTTTATDGGAVEAVGLWGRMERRRPGGPANRKRLLGTAR